MRSRLVCRTVLSSAAVFVVLLPAVLASAGEPTWPSAREIWRDDFEGSAISQTWENNGKGRISVSPSAKHSPSSSGLLVDVSGAEQAYLQRFHLTDWPHIEFKHDTYFRFWFHPNGVVIPSGETVRLAVMRDTDWNVMAGLRIRQEGSSYAVVLERPDGTIDAGSLPLSNDWHSLVMGCRMHDWVGAWVDSQQLVVHGVQHKADFVQTLIIGKTDGNWNGSTPSGSVFMDDATVLFAAYSDLWVDPQKGVDTADGSSNDAPLRTLSRATELSSSGTLIHLNPGDYRETLTVRVDGTADKPVRFEATGGPHTARILGSESASSVQWARLTDPSEIDLPSTVNLAQATIWRADVSAWGLKNTPRFVTMRGSDGTVSRLPIAREPDWQVQTDWKYHEFWWAAEGGTAASNCDPVAQRDCDKPERSDRYLVDKKDDPDPAGVELGSLASLGDVTGATIFAKDCITGFYTYRRHVAETVEPGKIRLERFPEQWSEFNNFDGDPDNPALGLYSKYFVEGLAKFLDTPGEWYFDQSKQVIYVWTPDGKSPGELGIEVSVRDTGVDVSHRYYVQLTNLDIQMVQDTGLRISNSDDQDKSQSIALQNLDIGWATTGIYLGQAPKKGSSPDTQIRTVILQDSRVHDIDGSAIATWTGSGSDLAPQPGITDFRLVHNEFARLGFRDAERGGVGLGFHQADHLLLEGNHVHHTAHTGVSIDQARTTSTTGFNLPPEAILTGDILVKNNLFENCVMSAGDASGLGFWGALADYSHTFRDTLVVGNVARNNVGYTWVSDKRQNWMYHGKGGMGYYINFAGGMHFFRNIAYNNGLDSFMLSQGWIDQPVVIANNTFANSVSGYSMGAEEAYSKQNVGFDSVNNVFLHMRRFAMGTGDSAGIKGQVNIDYNLYYLNGYEPWPQHTPGIFAGDLEGSGYQELPTIEEVRAKLGFEIHGVTGDPKFAGFDPAIDDGTWLDFRLTAASALAIDKGAPLPASLVTLLSKFGIDPGQKGTALDLGAIEFDPQNPDKPYDIDAGPSDGGNTSDAAAPWNPNADGSVGSDGAGKGDGGMTGAGPGAGGRSDDGGCGCRLGAGSSRSGIAALFWLLALLGARWRKK